MKKKPLLEIPGANKILLDAMKDSALNENYEDYIDTIVEDLLISKRFIIPSAAGLGYKKSGVLIIGEGDCDAESLMLMLKDRHPKDVHEVHEYAPILYQSRKGRKVRLYDGDKYYTGTTLRYIDLKENIRSIKSFPLESIFYFEDLKQDGPLRQAIIGNIDTAIEKMYVEVRDRAIPQKHIMKIKDMLRRVNCYSVPLSPESESLETTMRVIEGILEL